MSPRTVLTPADRRTVALAALSGEDLREIAERHGVTYETIRAYRAEARRDPEAALREAEEELEFRRRIIALAGNRTQPHRSGTR